MECCPCQLSGHFCMECEEELIAEMKRNDRERVLKEVYAGRNSTPNSIRKSC